MYFASRYFDYAKWPCVYGATWYSFTFGFMWPPKWWCYRNLKKIRLKAFDEMQARDKLNDTPK